MLLCPCADPACSGKDASRVHERVAALAARVEGLGGRVTSGLRCEAHNAAEHGEKGSRHLVGEALDFVVSNRRELVVDLLCAGGWRVITYTRDDHVHVHLDTEGRFYLATGGSYLRCL